MRLMQRDHQPALAAEVAAGPRRRLDGFGRPLPGRIRHPQHRALPTSGIVHEDQSAPPVEQGPQDVRTGFRPDHGMVGRVVEMVGALVISEPLSEPAFLHHYVPTPIETTKLTVSSRNGEAT